MIIQMVFIIMRLHKKVVNKQVKDLVITHIRLEVNSDELAQRQLVIMNMKEDYKMRKRQIKLLQLIFTKFCR